MRSSHLPFLLVIAIIIYFPQQYLMATSSDKMPSSFKFYEVGANDTIAIAAKKLAENGFDCASAKSKFLGVRNIQGKTGKLKHYEKIRKLRTIDEDIEEFTKGLEYEEIPIDALVCTPPKDSPFIVSTYFFSGFNQKTLAIDIEIEKFDLVEDKLTSKFGSCISEGYCESEDSIVILTKSKIRKLHVYFLNNIKPHYEKIKKLKELKDQNLKEKLNQAF
jgi:hypothetical protein